MGTSMESIAERIKQRRLALGLSYQDLANASGLSKSTLQRYETGAIGNIPLDRIDCLSKGLRVSPEWLLGWDEQQRTAEAGHTNQMYPYKPTHRIPILGRISAGLPLYAEENIEGYMMTELNGGAEYFALRVKGDSMTAARIYDGDILVVRRQDHVENGQIAVVLVNGDEATVKKFYRTDTTVSLVPQSLNPEHQLQIYDVSKTEVKVLGLVVQNVIQI
jgi:repressor LexA